MYVLMIANEYGQPDGDISATHHEYRQAQKLKLPTIVFLKGTKDEGRSAAVKALIEEAKRDGYTYKRFHDREDLRTLMLAALRRTLADEFDLKATRDEVSESEQQVEAASPFESSILDNVLVNSLDSELLNRFNHALADKAAEQVFHSGVEALHSRGLSVSASSGKRFHPTAAAVVMLAPRPANQFPQCEILADAYDESRITGRPKGQASINAPLPMAVEQALKFIDDHTFHPRRVVGLNNVRLDEYPVPALREVLVNAMAHRNYEDSARKTFVRVFSDRIEIASPGYSLKPLTPARLRKGSYRPCSRNPLIAQTIATLSLMEQRGTGFARMRDAMLDHGLDEPKIEQQDGFFVVTLLGPAGNYERIKTPTVSAGPVTPALEAQLNERQKRIMSQVLKTGAVTRSWCVAEFDVANDTAGRDLKALTELGLIEPQGKGRAVHYVVKSTDNRPIKS